MVDAKLMIPTAAPYNNGCRYACNFMTRNNWS